MKTLPDEGAIFRLCDLVRETSLEIHKYLRSGHLEQVYENALAHRLRKAGIEVRQNDPVQVLDEDGTLTGRLEADLVIDNRLIIEVKACRLFDW